MPWQTREPKEMSLIERKVVDKEIQLMLTKEVLREIQPSRDQFLSTIFVRPKKGENKFRPIINLKSLNDHTPYIHFKKEGMKDVVDLLNPGDYMVKIEVLACANTSFVSKVPKVSVEKRPYQISVLVFGVDQVPGYLQSC